MHIIFVVGTILQIRGNFMRFCLLQKSAVRKKYMLYDNKLSDGAESAQAKKELEKRMNAIGCRVVTDRGDVKK